MLAIFTRLTRHEPPPVTERVSARLRRLLRPAMVISIALIAVLNVLMFSSSAHSRSMCGATLALGRLGQAWSRTKGCSHVPANPTERLFDHPGTWGLIGRAAAGPLPGRGPLRSHGTRERAPREMTRSQEGLEMPL